LHHSDSKRWNIGTDCLVCLAEDRDAAIIRAKDFEMMLARLCRALEKVMGESQSATDCHNQAVDLLKRKGTASPLRK